MDDIDSSQQLKAIIESVCKLDFEMFKENIKETNEIKARRYYQSLTENSQFLMNGMKYFLSPIATERKEVEHQEIANVIIKHSGDSTSEMRILEYIGRRFNDNSMFAYIQNNVLERGIDNIEEMEKVESVSKTGDVLIKGDDYYFIVKINNNLTALKPDTKKGASLISVNFIRKPYNCYTYL